MKVEKENKTVMICFANRMLDMKDHVDDVEEAIHNANGYLISRNKMRIKDFRIDEHGFMHLSMIAPKGKEIKWGYTLRGLSRYLLRECEFPYKDYLVGNRLLYYFV